MVTEHSTDTAEHAVDVERQTAAVETEAGGPQAAPRQLMGLGLPPALPPQPTNLRLRQQALLQLQHSHGNAHVQRLLASNSRPDPAEVADPRDAAAGVSAGPSADGPFDSDDTKEVPEHGGADGALSIEPAGLQVIQRQEADPQAIFKKPVVPGVELGIPFMDQSLKVSFGKNMTAEATLAKKSFFEDLAKKLSYSDIIPIYGPAVAYVKVGPAFELTGKIKATLTELAPGPVAEGQQVPRRYQVTLSGVGELTVKLAGSIGAGVGAAGGGVGIALVGFVGLEAAITGTLEIGGTFWVDTDSVVPYSGEGTVSLEGETKVKGTGGIRLAWVVGDESGDLIKVTLVEQPIAEAGVRRKYALQGSQFTDVTEGEREWFKFLGLDWEGETVAKAGIGAEFDRVGQQVKQAVREKLGLPPDADLNDPAIMEPAKAAYKVKRDQELKQQEAEREDELKEGELRGELGTEELPRDEWGMPDLSEQSPLAKAYETFLKVKEQRRKVHQLERDGASEQDIAAARKELHSLEYQYQQERGSATGEWG